MPCEASWPFSRNRLLSGCLGGGGTDFQNDRFKQRIQEQLGRRVEPKASSGTENLKSLMPIATYQYFELKSDRVIWMSITRSRRTTAIGHIADVGWE